ncbi:dihydrolipoamide dehydrogenase [Paenibacillus uliginis N3/975]|uniref:Dihydrolipoyl dehydrogenase n=1 Tax=Paenibacillus uliginis N3/975 TaxID=1313296 RepID=A0A1X7HJE0_9BACL|nr:dihydrolipoyl dehydrogenase [Paenibacillus uliginis]SMF87617.1 dihydrolipoamide dehydrogenase [Paenibacillus uliginis N3/975]
MAITCDVAILGGGTGGYVAAIRAAQLGKDVVIIEQDKLGGTCLHRGCIPSKALLRSAEVFAEMKESESFGIEVDGVTLSFEKVQKRKENIVEKLHQGVQYLMRKNKIRVIHGVGRVIGPSIFSPRSGAVAVELADGDMETVVPTHLIIATGSRPRHLPGLEPDGKYVMTSDHALLMEELPSSIIIVGGGVIGVEWASMLNDFGVEVTIVESSSQLLPAEDEEIGKEMHKLLSGRGIKIMTGAELLIDTYEIRDNHIELGVRHGGKEHLLSSDKLLISVGRVGNAENIGLENTDVRIDKGLIVTNEFMQTTEPHIYAIGDVVGGLQLAHAASHEGIKAVHHLAGEKELSYRKEWIPRCIYTRPEAASVGLTEKLALEHGHEIKVGKFPFQANGKALVYGMHEGFVKVIADKTTNDLLGVHMIGPHVTELIGEAALAQVLDATPWEVGSSVHAHPTLSEIIGEAMLAVDGKSSGI